MRDKWRKQVEVAYTNEELSPEAGGSRVAVRLGVDSKRVDQLAAAIYADLDEETYGIGWWVDFGSAKRRIVVSDYLHQSVAAIGRNLLEARLHQLEAESAWDSSEEWFKRALLDAPQGDLLAPPKNAEEELRGTFGDIHAGGFFRAIGSVLDCIAAAVVGVAGLPRRIFRVQWKVVLDDLSALAEANDPRRDFAEAVMARRDSAGPEMWSEWAIEMRNMLVHRGRRVNINFVLPTSSLVYLPGGMAYKPHRVVPLFQRDPGLSEIEVMHLKGKVTDVVVPEPAEETANSIFESALFFANEFSSLALELWDRRRSDRGLVEQPLDKQWPEVREEDPTSFDGYNPRNLGTEHLNTIMVNPQEGKRITAALATDDLHPIWEQLD